MATMETALALRDGMSGPMQVMINNTVVLVNHIEAVQAASRNMIDTTSLQNAQTQISGVEEELARTSAQQEQLNSSIKAGTGVANQFWGGLKRAASQCLSLGNIKSMLSLSDQMAQSTARLNQMNDGMQTSDQLNRMIYESAQRSRSPYLDTAQAVAEMGNNAGAAFGSFQEVLAFVEQLNKKFLIAGASQQEMNSAMGLLSEGMGTGVLRGEELNEIFRAAPNIMQDLAGYLGVDTAQLQNMAAEGQITADIVKQAMFATADETNAKFTEMPKTFGQVWNVFRNSMIQLIQPLMQLIANVAGILCDHWDLIGPVVLGAATAIGVYLLMTKLATLWTTIQAAATGGASLAMGILALASGNAALAQTYFNTALATCPLLWIALLIGIVVGVILYWINAVGGMRVAWLIVVNTILSWMDYLKIGFMMGIYGMLDGWAYFQLGIAAVRNGILNTLTDLAIGGVMILEGFVNGAIDQINQLITLAQSIPGVAMDTIEHVKFGTEFAVKMEAKRKQENAEFAQQKNEVDTQILEHRNTILQMQAAADQNKALRQAEINQAKLDAANKKAAQNEQKANPGLGGPELASYGTEDSPLGQNMAATAGNTGRMADSMELSEEDVKYLRDVAERDVINRFTTAELSVSMNTTANINSGLDIDGVISQLENKTYETLLSAVEGVY